MSLPKSKADPFTCSFKRPILEGPKLDMCTHIYIYMYLFFGGLMQQQGVRRVRPWGAAIWVGGLLWG